MTFANKIAPFSMDSFFVFIAAILLSRLDTLLLKSAFVTKFASANLALKLLEPNVLNSVVVIY